MGEPSTLLSGASFEEALASLLYDEGARARLRSGEAADDRFLTLDVDELDEAGRGVRRMVLERTHRGTGGLAEWFPNALAAWRRSHPGDENLDDLLTLFCASPSGEAWREHGSGISLEEAWYRFWIAQGIGDDETTEEEFLGTIVRTLAISPGARFTRPSALRAAPGGCYAVSRRGVLHALLDGNYVRGALTPLVVALLGGAGLERVASQYGVELAQVSEVFEALQAKGLLPTLSTG